ncbi:fluoride efflux transporter FluC [Pseudaestuariivita sp.]|uniref:fluoride efflux transporter FluC n=1 Tax=Pseudaestuariivita sp. TaxID=2211669 RepID=UPI004059E396
MMVIYVALGGALGAALRYGATQLVAFPFGTLGVNVLGSCVIGALYAGVLAGPEQPRLAAFLVTGLLGGFTTFSAFSLDTLKLVQAGQVAFAAGYVSASVVLSLLACFAGFALVRGIV